MHVAASSKMELSEPSPNASERTAERKEWDELDELDDELSKLEKWLGRPAAYLTKNIKMNSRDCRMCVRSD